jgi:arylsulfatase A-like enzyme
MRGSVRVAILALPIGLAVAGAGIGWWASQGRRPNVVLVLVDTLRADHLGTYGYGRPTSPRIDAIAREGIVFERAYSVSPWTNPAIATLFTGFWPQKLMPPARHRIAIHQALPDAVETLAEGFAAAGYRTAALVDHPGITPKLNFGKGFETFVRLFEAGGFPVWGLTDSGFVLAQIERTLDADRARPLFLYLHLVYPHRPYGPPPPYDGMFGPGFAKLDASERAGIVNAYDAEIRYTDDLIGKLEDALVARDMWDATWLVLTSDHGEGFWEHGRGEHGNTLFDELLRIPLVVHPPVRWGGEPVRVPNRVSLVDVFPTLLGMAGIHDRARDGHDLLLLLDDGGLGLLDDRTIFAESPHAGDVHGAAVLRGEHKYIFWKGDPERVFDLAADPEERESLSWFDPSRMRDAREHLIRHRARSRTSRERWPKETRSLDADTVERLRALGYTD